MKKIILFFVAIALFATLSTQTSKCGVLELTSAETQVSGKPTDEIKCHAFLKNTSLSTTSIISSYKMTNFTKGHTYSVCTPVTCYPPKTADWSAPAFDLAGFSALTKESFYITLFPNNIEGISILTVRFTNAADATDYAEFNVTFTVSLSGITEYYTQNSTAYPNPATNTVNIKLDNKTTKNSQFNVYSETGSIVYSSTVSVDTDNIGLDLNSFSNGIYFFTLTDETGNLSSGKFTVLK